MVGQKRLFPEFISLGVHKFPVQPTNLRHKTKPMSESRTALTAITLRFSFRESTASRQSISAPELPFSINATKRSETTIAITTHSGGPKPNRTALEYSQFIASATMN